MGSILLIALLYEAAAADSLVRRTGSQFDTAEERISNGSMYITSSDLELVYDGHKQAVGIRFPNITVPKNATITSAYIQFHADGTTTSTPVNLTIKGEASDDASSFGYSYHDVTGRSTTGAVVYWDDIPAWSHDNDAGSAQRTPNLKSIVQEIVNRGGWSSGNAMAFIITEHGDNGSRLRRAETHHGDDESPTLYIEYTTGGSSGCGGCDCSLDKEPDNDSSPGVAIPGLDGATSDASRCISGSSENDDEDYYHFTVQTPGQLDITTSSPNGHDYHMEIVSDVQGTLLSYDTDQNRNLSYTLSAGEKITVLFKESGDDLDEYQANFTFTKSNTGCDGCDCSLDKEPDNDSNPGVLIPDLDQVDHNVTTCFSGESENDDKDYYHFTTASGGILHVLTSSPNNHRYHMEIQSNKQGTLLSYDTGENRDLTYTLTPNERITFLFKETGDDKDKYQANVTFTVSEYIESADDICYVGDPVTSGLCTGIGGLDCTKTITLKSLDNIDDVKAIIDASSLMSGNLFSDCGVDGVSGTDKNEDEDGACYVDNDINMGPVGMFNKGVQYNVASNMQQDENHSIYDYALFDISFFKTETLYATYTKNGQKYRGKVKQCSKWHCTNLSKGDRDFTIRNPENTRNIYGNYTVIGNENLCTDHNEDGTCVGDTKTTSNSHPSLYVDVDDNASTVNSSSSTLSIPSGAKVVWAGLYWQGTIHNSDNDDDPYDEDFGRDNLWVEGNKILGATNVDDGHKEIDLLADNNGYGAYNACKVKFKVPGKGYVEVAADQLDFYQLGYGGYADVTKLLDADNPNGVYTVADIKSQTGRETDHGNYAAWSLVVIYKKDDDKFRNISVFDGYVTVNSAYRGELHMNGFLTRKAPPVRSKLAFFTLDGDGGRNSISVDDQKISNANHPADRFFNSTISSDIVRDPDYVSARVDLDYIDLVDVLKPSQTSAVLKPRSKGDRYTGSYFIMSADLRQVDICYDYTYGQSGAYRTAPSIKPAIIQGSFNSDPIDVKLYFKNQENSDIEIKNLYVNIDPIDSNTTYKSNSTYVTPPKGQMTFVPDSGRVTSSTRDDNISIGNGNLNSLDYFYVYYSLKHSQPDINAKIHATLHFDLVVNTGNEVITLGNSQADLQTMQPCQNSNVYQPAPGYFNVVHKAFYKDDSNYYFNLPTQIVGRYTDKFLVESMDPDDLNKTKTGVKDKNVTVEMLDVSGFHYSTATCTDSNATVISGQPITVIFNNDNTTFTVPLDKSQMSSYGFFERAIQNAAFRMGYYIDDNASQRVYTCSRDNFAIRPEAFHMHLSDSNKSNGNISVPEGSAQQNIVAEYDYDIDVNATTYGSSTPAKGYTKSFDGVSSTNDSYGFKWSSSKDDSVCNDTSDKNASLTFIDGKESNKVSVDQVGEYTLLLRDRTWTTVDSNLSFMTHHIGGYFKPGRDCKNGSTIVGSENDTNNLNGCDISSDYAAEHYSDYYLKVLPYRFELGEIAASLGLKDLSVGNNAFVYMSDVTDANDRNMSYHLYGAVKAVGGSGTVMSNFVDGCYAEDLDLDLENDYEGSSAMQYYIDTNDTAIAVTVHEGNITKNDTDTLMQKAFFAKGGKGKAQIFLRYNIKRAKDTAINPVKVRFGDFNATFHTPPSGNIYAKSGSAYKISGRKNMNDTLYFYYAKAHVKDTNIKGNNGNAIGHYEVYCYGNGCNKNYLQDELYGGKSSNSDDPRWWINSKHTDNFGKIHKVVQKKTPLKVKVTTTPTGNATETIGLQYDGTKGYPYRTIMKIVPDDWLVYNRYNANADHNEFEVKFESAGGKWAGKDESNSSTRTSNADKNRILQW